VLTSATGGAADTVRMFGTEDFLAWFAETGTGGPGSPANPVAPPHI